MEALPKCKRPSELKVAPRPSLLSCPLALKKKPGQSGFVALVGIEISGTGTGRSSCHPAAKFTLQSAYNALPACSVQCLAIHENQNGVPGRTRSKISGSFGKRSPHDSGMLLPMTSYSHGAHDCSTAAIVRFECTHLISDCPGEETQQGRIQHLQSARGKNTYRSVLLHCALRSDLNSSNMYLIHMRSMRQHILHGALRARVRDVP